MIGMPTPYCAPSAFKVLMCTGVFGFAGLVEDALLDGAVDVEDDPAEEALVEPLDRVEAGDPVVLLVQAVRTASALNTARVRAARRCRRAVVS
jgi:hypothetical protein